MLKNGYGVHTTQKFPHPELLYNKQSLQMNGCNGCTQGKVMSWKRGYYTSDIRYPASSLPPTIVNVGSLKYDPEIIEIVDESSKIIKWNTERKSKYGLFPIIQCWLKDENDVLYLSSVQPNIDFPPPNLTQITFTFTEPENGFILITN